MSLSIIDQYRLNKDIEKFVEKMHSQFFEEDEVLEVLDEIFKEGISEWTTLDDYRWRIRCAELQLLKSRCGE